MLKFRIWIVSRIVLLLRKIIRSVEFIFCIMFRKKVVVTIHGIDWQRAKWSNKFASKYIRFGERMAVKYADGVIVLSNGVRDYFMDVYNVKTVFLPNGVKKPNIRPADKITAQWGLKKDDYDFFRDQAYESESENFSNIFSKENLYSIVLVLLFKSKILNISL